MTAKEMLSLRGVNTHHLKGFDLDIPLGKLVALVGVSGSGKSSLAIHTIHAESQRRLMMAIARGALRSIAVPPRPDIGSIDGLPTTIALSPPTRQPHHTSTIGTVSGVDELLRVLVASMGTCYCPKCDEPLKRWTRDEIVGHLASLPEGSRLYLEAPVCHERGQADAALISAIASAGFSRIRLGDSLTRIEDFTPGPGELRVVVDRLTVKATMRSRLQDSVGLALKTGRGSLVVVCNGDVLCFTDRLKCLSCDLILTAPTSDSLSHRGIGACTSCEGRGVGQDDRECVACQGRRRRPETEVIQLAGMRLHQLVTMNGANLLEWLLSTANYLDDNPAHIALTERLTWLTKLGIDLISLDRSAGRVSTGEWQRARLAGAIGDQMTGVLYLFDEPTTGLGQTELNCVIDLLRALCRAGNSVLTATHHRALIQQADWVVELGPSAGAGGGELLFQGPVEALKMAQTPTGEALRMGPCHLPSPVPLDPSHLQGVTTIFGPSGSGKSRTLARLATDEVVREHFRTIHHVAWRSVSGTSTSTPATYLGLWSRLRDLMTRTRAAKIRGIKKAHLSLNKPGGRCERCAGVGEVTVDMGPLPPLHQCCPSCHGRRFTEEVLEVRWRGLNAGEILAMTVSDARKSLAGHPHLEQILMTTDELGLGYMTLGQGGHTWSTGEARRLVLARAVCNIRSESTSNTLLLLDSPTAGLHPQDANALFDALRHQAQRGVTIVAASHDRRFASRSDQLIALLSPIAPAQRS